MKGWGILLLVWLAIFSPFVLRAGVSWQRVAGGGTFAAARGAAPAQAVALMVQEDELKTQLMGMATTPEKGGVMDLPMGDGSVRQFRIWRSAIMEDGLAAKYAGISTYTGEAVDNPNITAKLDYTVYGFHAIVFDGINISMVDPAGDNVPGHYMAHYKRDEVRQPAGRMKCEVHQKGPHDVHEPADVTSRSAYRTSNGYELRTYRLALACNSYYAAAATRLSAPSIAQVLSKMITTLNRVNGVYERELSVTMVLVANEDTLIWNVASGGMNGDDPFASMNDNASGCVSENQTVCDARIGSANYDVGHVFTTGAGGLSQIGVICQPYLKAQSVTGQPDPVGDGFDIDYVAHEMGHEYGGDHPFNNGIDGSCYNNNNPMIAYEPGSGSTIMAYAGICSPDDLQPHSDPYFHSVNLEELQSFINGQGDGCAVHTPTNNKLVSLPGFTASYVIPYLTPFELTAPSAVDSVADTLITYCWEQWNLGDANMELVNTHYSGPIFRSYLPTTSPTRVFPTMRMVLADSLSNAGIEDAEGEKAPDVARYLTFKLSVRDIYQGNGCFVIPDDSVHLDVINTGSGFAVTSQNTAGGEYLGSTPLAITWNVAGSNAAPINTANVDIYLSGDGGYTWPYPVGTFVNNGAAQVILPNPDTTISNARLKIKGDGNVFFNVNKSAFTLYHNSSPSTEIQVFPSPVHDVLQVYPGDKGILRYEVCNAVGRQMLHGEVAGELEIAVNYWPRGVYIIKLIDAKNERTVKKFVVE